MLSLRESYLVRFEMEVDKRKSHLNISDSAYLYTLDARARNMLSPTHVIFHALGLVQQTIHGSGYWDPSICTRAFWF